MADELSVAQGRPSVVWLLPALVFSREGGSPLVMGSTHTCPVKVSAGPFAVSALREISMCAFLACDRPMMAVGGQLADQLDELLVVRIAACL